MKKVVILAILSVYILSTTELYQFLKIPSLFEHYLEHKSKNKDITFSEFVYMHYSQENDFDGDHEKDMKLPFKSHSCCNYNSLITFATQPNFTFLKVNFIETKKSTVNFYNFILSSSHLKAIWQPPQIC